MNSFAFVVKQIEFYWLITDQVALIYNLKFIFKLFQTRLKTTIELTSKRCFWGLSNSIELTGKLSLISHSLENSDPGELDSLMHSFIQR